MKGFSMRRNLLRAGYYVKKLIAMIIQIKEENDKTL